METPLEETTTSLERMRTFDSSTLVREAELGTVKNFQRAIEPADRLVALYKRLSPAALPDFSADKLAEVKSRANADYNILNQILSFDPDRTSAERDSIITQLTDTYAPTFNVLHPLIAYSLHRAADFQRLDSDARATLQSIQDRANQLTLELEGAKGEAARILDEVRAIAAETGVSQQASYFRDAANIHNEQAAVWRKRVVTLACATAAFAVASMVIHKLPFLRPESVYDTVQIAISKILIFAVLSYVLYLAARNFLSHTHNEIVNRHRQQALQTYQALVDAAAQSANRDIILNHAAACIFGPQSTGYSSDGPNQAPSAKSVVELLGSNMTKGVS